MKTDVGPCLTDTKALRKQVMAEVKLRRYFWNTMLSLGLIYLAATLTFGEMGFMRYIKLKERQASIQMDLNGIMQQNQSMADRLQSMDSDSYYIEKHARESFGMASDDEYIFIFKE